MNNSSDIHDMTLIEHSPHCLVTLSSLVPRTAYEAVAIINPFENEDILKFERWIPFQECGASCSIKSVPCVLLGCEGKSECFLMSWYVVRISLLNTYAYMYNSVIYNWGWCSLPLSPQLLTIHPHHHSPTGQKTFKFSSTSKPLKKWEPFFNCIQYVFSLRWMICKPCLFVMEDFF